MAIENTRMLARQTTDILKQTVQETASNSSDSTKSTIVQKVVVARVAIFFILYQIAGYILYERVFQGGF